MACVGQLQWQLQQHQDLLWNKTASERNSTRCWAHSSRITLAWTNSITASITQVYTGREKALCRTTVYPPPLAPTLLPSTTEQGKGEERGKGVGFMGGKHEVHLFSGCVRVTQVNVEGGFSIHKRKKIIINLFASQSLGKRICISASIFYNISFTTFTMFLFVFTVTVYWLCLHFGLVVGQKLKFFRRSQKCFCRVMITFKKNKAVWNENVSFQLFKGALLCGLRF